MCIQIFISLLLFSCSLLAQAPQLTLESIRPEMEKILHGALTQKKMTPELLQDGLKDYITQFDPYAVYLLEEEIAPFLNLSNETLKKLYAQYNVGSFERFKELNTVIQKAIRRMREFRRNLVASQEEFSKLTSEPFSKDQKRPASLDALKQRHAIYLALLVKKELVNAQAEGQAERRQVTFLDAVRIVELDLEETENSYLFIDAKQKPYPPAEAQSVLAFHILRALTASLDAHSAYLNPEEAAQLRMKLEKNYVGVGIGIKESGHAFVVASIVKGSSADSSGVIHVGDDLTSIDGTSVSHLTLSQVQELLSGDVHSSVTLVLKRHFSDTLYTLPVQVTLQRENIVLLEGRVDTSFQKVSDGIIGIINLHAFYEGAGGISSEKDMKNAFSLLEKQGNIKGIILDLRDNRGGFLMQAVKVAGLFIKSGVIVAAKYSNDTIHYFRDLDPSEIYTGPLIVLVSKETASAAEIVAQALKDYGVAIIVGDAQTFGKGSIQMQTVTNEKEGQSYFKVTVGRYYSVSGLSTQLTGVKADIVVPSLLSERKVGEQYLPGAIKGDTIPPSYKDPLTDIPKSERPWYQKYYVPFIQPKVDTYRKYIPELAKLSAARLETNRNYQNLLGGNSTIQEKEGLTMRTITLDQEGVKRTFLAYQLEESVNIMKDLIQLSKTN